MKSRQFFVSNSIQNFQALTKRSPFQQKDYQKIGTSSSKRIKRVTSCHNSTSKLDPSKFINRQVFNSKLYSAKAFNIAVQFLKQKQNQSNQYFSFNENESFVSLKKKLQSKENGQEFTSAMINVSHHMKNIYLNIGNDENNKSVKLIKQELFLLKEGFEKVLKSLSKQIQYHQQRYIKALFQQKSQQIKSRDFSQSTNLLNGSRSIVSSRTPRESKFQRTPQQFIFQRKPSTLSTNLKQSRVQNQQQNSSLPNKLKLIKDKMGIMQFENKKHILRIEYLQSQNITLKERINELQNNINQMTDKINKVKQIEDFYNYKIKKLKQELEVAHIVKQQNLAQKMRYILHNQ